MTQSTIQSSTIKLPNLKLETRILKSGTPGAPAILLLHGNPDNAEEWQGMMKLLSLTHFCIAPDLPGYGKSPLPPSSFDYSQELQIQFVDELLSELKITGKVTIVVHDIGGVMGIPWAAKNIDRVQGMIVTNTIAFSGFKWFDTALTWGDVSLRGRFRSKLGMWIIGRSGGTLFKKIFAKQNRDLPFEEVERMADLFATNKAAKDVTLRLFPKMTNPAFFDDYQAYVKVITDNVPVVVVWGAKDPYIPVEWAKSFGNAKVKILEDAGHWVPITCADQVVEAARENVFSK